MMFLRSIGSVFTGFSAFPEFAKRNAFRALFHLLLFCILLACIFSGVQTYYAAKKINICTNGLEKQFGRIVLSEKGVLPEKNPDQSWSFIFPGGFRLDYLTSADELTAEEMNGWEQVGGILWARRGFLIWHRLDRSGKAYYLMPYVRSKEAMRFLPSKQINFKPVNQAAVCAELKRYQEKVEIKGTPSQYTEFSLIGKVLKIYIYFVLVFFSAVGDFILTLFLILMYAALQSLWKAPGLEMLTFGRTVAVLSYAAFPALAVRMLLGTFGFPGIGEVLFFIVFFIYQMVAFHRIRSAYTSGGPMDGAER